MVAIVLKRPRVEAFPHDPPSNTTNPYSLCTIHPAAKKQLLKNPESVLKLSTQNHTTQLLKQKQNNSEVTKKITNSNPFSVNVTDADAETKTDESSATKSLGFQANGLFSHLGATNIVTEGLLKKRKTLDTNYVTRKSGSKSTTPRVSRSRLLRRIELAPFLTKSQKTQLIRKIQTFKLTPNPKHRDEKVEERFGKIYQYLTMEQERYLHAVNARAEGLSW